MDTTTAADQQVARDISRKINTNRPRRATANYSNNISSLQFPQKVTRASKRIRLQRGNDSLTSESSKPSLMVQLKIRSDGIPQSPALSNPAGNNDSAGASDPAYAIVSASVRRPAYASDSASVGRPGHAGLSPGVSDLAAISRPTCTSRSAKAKPRSKAAPKPYHENVQAKNLTQPLDQPPAWADKRQPLCETLPWYRAYQSGLYQHNGVAIGFMVDKEVTHRDIFDEEILIASCGGGRAKDENGKMVRNKDQITSHIAAAFQMAIGKPVGLIAGCGNPISPISLPHTYNVLDWFSPTDVWQERQNGVIVWMVRLEKINLAEKSWWAPQDSKPLPENRDLGQFKTIEKECQTCNKSSKEIYNTGWTCLQFPCPDFFKFPQGYDDATLTYNEQFKKERTKYSGPTKQLTPSLLTNEDLTAMDAFGIEKECKRGIVCPKCKCCSRRIEWQQWSCENPICDFTYRTSQEPVPISEVMARSDAPKSDIVGGGIQLMQKVMQPYTIHEYVLPDENGQNIGFVRHFKANGLINKQYDGPNDLFCQMQERDFGMKRNVSRQKDSTGEVLTSHWASNWGAPYKFGVSVLSKGFDEAPPVILKALQRLTWAGNQAVTENLEPFHPFNELLSLGYFEDSHISYHDDGEKELGPTVATLSLGASAAMSFRPKKKSNVGERASSARKGKAEKGKENEGNKKCVLRFTINHGDIVVMHGREIQKLYEHKVDPQGKLRFALTCRYIDPDTITDPREHEAALVKGKIPANYNQYAYDGDINAKDFEEKSTSVEDPLAAVTRFLADYHAGNIRDADLYKAYQMFTGVIDTMGHVVAAPDVIIPETSA